MIDSVQNAQAIDLSFYSGEKEGNPLGPQREADYPQKEFALDRSQRPSDKETEKKNSNALDENEKQQVRDLQKRDSDVRNHENAHLAAAGSLAMGGPQYVYQVGPDGKSYAVGGHVQIDTSPGNTPEETISKARQIRASALAPADPSGQDIKVASAASKMEAEATKEASSKQVEGLEKTSKTDQPKSEQLDKASTSRHQIQNTDDSIDQSDGSNNLFDSTAFQKRVSNTYAAPAFSGQQASFKV